MKGNLIKKERLETEAGFSMLEVLVAAMVIFFFLIGSIQAIVLATMLRVNAQTKSDALNLINQEAEAIKFQAFMLNRNTTTNTYPSTAAACTSGYGSALQSSLGALNLPSSVTLVNKSYPVSRTYTANSKTLQITWRIDRDNNATNNNDIATMTTEVLPDGALFCP